jgi:hypothetical protein
MYSIIYETKIIDVIQKPVFVKVLPSGHVTFTDKASANGIVGSDGKTIYGFEQVSRKNTKVVKMKEISEKEFNRLKGLLNSSREITADKQALAMAIKEAISNLSKTCNNKIIEGFSIRLSDGKKHSFKLTVEDQLNLLSLENQINNDTSHTFIYHETGKPCQVYSRTDMSKIIKAFRQHTMYHTTYFNVAKQYIMSLVDIDEVTAFTYGTNVSWFVKDDTIKQILKNGGHV